MSHVQTRSQSNLENIPPQSNNGPSSSETARNRGELSRKRKECPNKEVQQPKRVRETQVEERTLLPSDCEIFRNIPKYYEYKPNCFKKLRCLSCYECRKLGVFERLEATASGLPLLRVCDEPTCAIPVHEKCSTWVSLDSYEDAPFYCSKHNEAMQQQQEVVETPVPQVEKTVGRAKVVKATANNDAMEEIDHDDDDAIETQVAEPKLVSAKDLTAARTTRRRRGCPAQKRSRLAPGASAEDKETAKKKRNKKKAEVVELPLEPITKYTDEKGVVRDIVFDHCTVCNEEGVLKELERDASGSPLIKKCLTCKRKVHEHCAMYLLEEKSPENPEPAFYCKRHSNQGPTPRADELPITLCSDFMEAQVNRLSEGDHIPKVTIRQMQDSDGQFDLPEHTSQILPKSLKYRSKTFTAFMEIGGSDVAFFSFVAQEFGEMSHHGNNKLANIEYLDSLRVLLPFSSDKKRRLFHRILIAYFDYARCSGFTQAHIYASNPLNEYEEYLFFSRPWNQKTPTESRLLEFYDKLMVMAKERKVVRNYTTGDKNKLENLTHIPVFNSGQFFDALIYAYTSKRIKIHTDVNIMRIINRNYSVKNCYFIELNVRSPVGKWKVDPIAFEGDQFFADRKRVFDLAQTRNWTSCNLSAAQYTTMRFINIAYNERFPKGNANDEPSTSSQ